MTSQVPAFVLADPPATWVSAHFRKAFLGCLTSQFMCLQHLTLSTILLMRMLTVGPPSRKQISQDPRRPLTYLTLLLSCIAIVQGTLVLLMVTRYLLISSPSFRCQSPASLAAELQNVTRVLPIWLVPGKLGCGFEQPEEAGSVQSCPRRWCE